MKSLNTLHILNKTPGHHRYSACLSAMGPDDGLLLIENGVLAVTQSLDVGIQYYALAPDLAARGITAENQGVQMVSFDDMVALTSAAGNVISW